MLKRSVRRLIIPSIYALAILIVSGGIFIIVNSINKYLNDKIDYKYSIDNVFEDVTPVVTDESTIIKPYLAENVKIGKYFYDFEGNSEEQINSIIYYENTYMQNSGVDYISEETFDVVSILDGEIIKVSKDDTLGNTVQVKHDNDLISIYQGIDNIAIKQGSKINQGDIIGTSGKSIINPDYKNVLHFEIYFKGKLMDPENLYSLTIEDLQ